MNRNDRIQTAQNTLKIIEQGFYKNKQGKDISIKEPLEVAINGSIHYTPESIPVYHNNEEGTNTNYTTFEVMNASSLEAAFKLNDSDVKNVLCLNFASAKNPGGGFLNGSQAQEESLARSSGLYPCLISKSEMYAVNRSIGTCLYTDHMIYSPLVPVIKCDEGHLLDNFQLLSFITSPAVNAGAIKKNEPENMTRIEEVMLNRIEKVLSVAIHNGHKNLILGAWGCGVFQNDPAHIAKYFAMHLKEGKFLNVFENVVFAIKSQDPIFIKPFRELFSNR